MTANQRKRLVIAAKDLTRALCIGPKDGEDLMALLASLRFEIESARNAQTVAIAGNQNRTGNREI